MKLKDLGYEVINKKDAKTFTYLDKYFGGNTKVVIETKKDIGRLIMISQDNDNIVFLSEDELQAIHKELEDIINENQKS